MPALSETVSESLSDLILHDATLREIAARRPATLAELGEISGLGVKKLGAYGEAVLEVVAEG